MTDNVERVREILTWAYERSPFYRKRLEAAGLRPEHIRTADDFRLLVPSWTKEDIIRAQAEDPPYGGLLSVPSTSVRRIYVAPGPVVSAFTEEDYAAFARQAAAALMRMGCRPGDVVDVTFQFNWVTAGTLYDEALRMAGCAVVPGGAGNSAVHIQNMKLLGVTVLVGFPTFLEHLIDVAREEGVDPARDFRVRLVIFAGELRRSDMKKYLGAAFGGADVREHYATADVGVVAYECEYGNGMHLMEDQYVEVLDPETAEPVGPGQPGEVYVTSLKRRAMPIIRYRTWDLTSGLDPTACPCGASTPRMGYIIGRVGTIPRVKGLFVNPGEVREVLASFPQVGRFQLVVDRQEGQDLLVVRVEVRRAVADPDSQVSLRTRLTEALRNRLRLTPVVELVGEGAIGEDSPTVVDSRRV